MTGSEFAKRVLELDPKLDADLVERAHDVAARAHEGQTRKSGDPYVTHAEMAAEILAQLQLDSATVAAGLLHDVVEESDVDLASIREEFGEEVAELVDGVTKITGLKFESREREQAENFRKMLLSVVKDVRVILIKLADRLHNMRTISHLTPAQIERISRETREIYAPLAGRFGMARIQRELEDLSFRWLEPDAHKKLERALSAGRLERDVYIEQISRPIREALEREGVDARIFGRAKHLYSIHKKMLAQDKTVDEIYDLVAMRIITSTVGECYRSLGTVHTLYVPIHDRIKDFVATPKLNGYRALHTTVIGPRGQMVEIQIRTEEMHEQAEMGIAAHWTYKEGSPVDDELRESLAWVRQLLEGNIDLTEADEFLESLKVDLYREVISAKARQHDIAGHLAARRGRGDVEAVLTRVAEHLLELAAADPELMRLMFASNIDDYDVATVLFREVRLPYISFLTGELERLVGAGEIRRGTGRGVGSIRRARTSGRAGAGRPGAGVWGGGTRGGRDMAGGRRVGGLCSGVRSSAVFS